jgi:hypothetical protein
MFSSSGKLYDRPLLVFLFGVPYMPGRCCTFSIASSYIASGRTAQKTQLPTISPLLSAESLPSNGRPCWLHNSDFQQTCYNTFSTGVRYFVNITCLCQEFLFLDWYQKLSKLAEVVTCITCIQKTTGPNLSQYTDYPDWGLMCFLSVPGMVS